jgi:hypothetical protein
MDRLSKDIWDQIKVDVPRDLRAKLDDIPTTKRWSEIRDVIQEDETILKTMQDGWEKAKQTIPFTLKKTPPYIFKAIPWDNVTKLVNFVLTGQMQTTKELYERLVRAGAVKGSALTYLRAVAPTLLIPTIMATGKTIFFPAVEGIEGAINSVIRFFGGETEINVVDWEPVFEDGKYNLSLTIKDNFKSLVGDESSFFQYQGSDFIPGVNSYIDDLVDWYFSIGYKDPSDPPKPEKTFKDVVNDMEVSTVKKFAPETIKDYIWMKDDGNVYLAAIEVNSNGDEIEVDYPITFENGVYMVETPEGKIKLKDY